MEIKTKHGTTVEGLPFVLQFSYADDAELPVHMTGSYASLDGGGSFDVDCRHLAHSSDIVGCLPWVIAQADW